jgi:uncharacterized delta-60 repeat protein
MRKLLSIALCTLATSIAFSQAGAPVPGYGTNGTTSKTVDQNNQTWGMGIQNDGKVIVTGNSTAISGSGHRFTMVRYNINGTVDNTFDGDGAVVTTFYNYEWIRAVAINSVNGKIAAAGYTLNGSTGNMALAVYNADGSPDLSFSGDGKHTDAGFQAFAAAWQSDGKLLVAGGGFIVRYNADGTLDASFSGDGKATASGAIYSMFLMDDGRIVVGGTMSNEFFVSRFNSDGTLDTTFDSDGIAQTSMGSGTSTINGLALQSDGKIVAAGEFRYTDWSDMTQYQVALARFNSNGALDATFDGDGKLLISQAIYPGGVAKSVTVQKNDGKILVTGLSMGVARFNSNGSFDATFDGDGRVAVGMIDGVGVKLWSDRIYVASSYPANFSLTAYQNDVIVLPVRLSGFDAVKKNSAVQLTWQTSAEENTSHFEVQRSIDGRTYTKIGSVTAGNSHYSFADNAPAPSVNVYRLKIVDNDGKSYFSKTVLVKISANEQLELYPNPADNLIYVHRSSNGSSILIMDAGGKVVKTVALNNTDAAITIDISSLSKGVYFINNGKESVQFVKQ